MAPPEDWVVSWLAIKEQQRCSERTISAYRWGANRIRRALEAAERFRPPARWTAADLRWLRARFRGRLLGLVREIARHFGNPLYRAISLGPAPPRRLRRSLSEEETRAILDVVRWDRPLRLAVLLGVAQGLRASDWIRLRGSDLDLTRERLRIRRVRRGVPWERWVPMHPAIPSALADYLWYRRRKVRRFLRRVPNGAVADELFVREHRGALGAYRAWAPIEWPRRIERRLAARGIRLRLTTEMLRHRGAVLRMEALRPREATDPGSVDRGLREFLSHRRLLSATRFRRRGEDPPTPSAGARRAGRRRARGSRAPSGP